MSAAVAEIARPVHDNRVIQCGLHKVFPERDIPKIGRFDSLQRERLLSAMGLNALYYYKVDGEIKPTKHEKHRQ